MLYRLKGGTLVSAYIVTRFILPACQYVNALDGLLSHRLELFNAVPTPTTRNLLLSQHSFYLHFAECLCAFHFVNICRARRLSIPLYRFVGTKIHIKLYLSSTFTIFNITLTFIYI